MTNSDKKMHSKNTKYNCCFCNFNTSNKYNYSNHLLTRKHLKAINSSQVNVPKNTFVCDCGKSYKFRQNLHTHKTNCSYQVDPKSVLNVLKISEKNQIDSSSFTVLILKLINENQDIKNMMITENKDLRNQISEIIPMIGNNNNNNIHQKININVFLNEYCKDAISINQFMDTIDIDMDHLKVTMNKGLVEGITNIIMEKMSKLSLYERPIHCTDLKRETMYIKSNNHDKNKPPKWEKDTDNIIIKKFLRDISRVQISGIKKWMDTNPGWDKSPALQEEYLLMLRKCTDDLKENNRENKIIRKISNEVCKGIP
jgi:hypothetical protein